jgi:aldose 1-epimerase
MNKLRQLFALTTIGIAAGGLTGCTTMNTPKGIITQADFGRTPEGQAVDIYTLQNSAGCAVKILTYGGIVQSLAMPDRHGQMADIVLGYDTLAGYLTNSPYFGALIGRYGNRIGGAQFTLAGETYPLATNNGPNSLHGGLKGFDKVVWTARPVPTAQGPALILTYVSKDGEEGFPGNLEVTAIYTLTEKNELKLEFTAKTDQLTVVNLTHHSYFNLAGQGQGDILGHVVYLNAEQTTPVDSGLIPTGKFADVTGTPFDFRKPTAIGARINDPDPVLQYGPGYDHNWVIHKPLGEYGLMARVVEPTSGRVMEVWSDEPGLQFYAGNFLDGTIHGKAGAVYQRRTGFCMEPQHYPDSPNKPQFPSVALKPGQTFRSTLVYKFSTE